MEFCQQIQAKPEWFDATNDALARVMTAVRRTNLKGELNIKIKVEPTIDRDGNTIATMRMEITEKCPQPAPGIQTVYIITDVDDRAVELSREHPAQMAMFRQMDKQQKGDTE